MKKIFIPLFLASLLLICTESIFAVEPFPSANNFGVMLAAGDSIYQEPPTLPPSLIIAGQHYSLGISYINYHPNHFLFSLSQRFAMGPVDYQSFQGAGTVSNARDTLFHTRLFAGYTVFRNQIIDLIPFIGFGYRNLYNNLQLGSVDVALGDHLPLREISYYYSPIGTIFTIQTGSHAAIESQIEYDLFWHGQVITHAFQVDGIPMPQVTNTQTQGYGLRASIEFLIPHHHHLFKIGPYVHYWNIRNSNTVTVSDGTQIVEPDNSTLEVGAEATLLF